MDAMTHKAAFIVAALLVGSTNAVIRVVADTLVDTSTARALIIGLSTAAVTGAFGVWIAKIQAKSDRITHERLDALEAKATDVQRKVGANRRESDPDGSQEAPTSAA